ncbi:heavy-metal-associated domain-containing protein [uncultured Senegalimassilia sp.]|uniref:heavy-metal-associated domain-containing protein n=1 Tax=uncultured Senegalimassilia sp. TaxID=1714350 RepID=UPI0026712890|nr:heavy metal-associated domain-containing protein [uncultured Senegalimassilia sp.]
MVATVIICIAIVIAGLFAGRQAIRTFSGDGSCCGKKSAKKARRVRVTDTDEANYPYTTDVPVGGMTCEKCVAAVENALNSIDGVWARVNLAEKNAHVLSKQPLDMERAKDVLRDAGYYVIQR